MEDKYDAVADALAKGEVTQEELDNNPGLARAIWLNKTGTEGPYGG